MIVLAVLMAACGNGNVPAGDADREQVMAAALVELITVNHTFGDGPPPFNEYLIQSSLDPFAGEPTGSGDADVRDLTSGEQSAILTAIAPYGPVTWIEDPSDFQTDDLMPAIEGAAILGVGEPTFEGEIALVPVSLWCGGLCGTWLTYKVEKVDGEWMVTGIEGPIAVS